MKSLHHHRFIPKTLIYPQISTAHPLNPPPNRIRTQNPPPNPPKIQSFLSPLTLALASAISAPLPSLASEADHATTRINLESIVVSIDDFFNRYPFFVAGVTFIWLVVIPLTEEYLKKCKFISALDAFRKLRDDPGSQLLDVRRKESVAFIAPPNLKILNKSIVGLVYAEGDDESFLKEVMKRFGDPGNTVICVLDNFDGNSLKVAELLFKNGFKEAYAIKGGIRGPDGWQATQEKYFPPSMHVILRNQSKPSPLPVLNGQKVEQNSDNGQVVTSIINQDSSENGSVKPFPTAPEAKLAPQKPLSPFPNYPDLKPPSSPTPSKP